MDMSPDFKILLENGVGDGTVDAMVTLLVALAPNISSLDLDQLFALEMPLLGDFFKQNLCASPPTQNAGQPFSRLQKVGVLRDRAYMSRENGLNAMDRLAFFYLPAIKSLSISIDDPDNFAWPGPPPTVSTLTSLQLDKIREPNLGPILEATPNLKQLNWTWLYGSCADKRYGATLNLDTLMAAMQPLSHSLCELVLDGNHALTFKEIRPPVLDIRGSLTGLMGFVSLRKLVLPWVFCMDTSSSKGPSMLDQLPCNLETLVLTDGFRENKWMKWDDHIWGSSHDNDRCALARALVRTLQQKTRDVAPQLRRVALAWTPKISERTEDILDGIEHIREDTGVEIVWQTSYD
ncbi:hypothetical protein NLG97_g6522 [Lecanicillium saksenae]|uniref:Uncharacterized protein n=1 Tax=Lecanicillium saksenae TaxID=468837 RepID=A0ACC1QQH9_9HYPO|nr:hypothetical protein NLG97_g6522 [Lecanicillium saksenae]